MVEDSLINTGTKVELKTTTVRFLHRALNRVLFKRFDMWITGKVDLSSQKEALLNELAQECRLAAPGARLSYSLRNRLEKFPKEERRDIVNRVKDGCAPLFTACKRGHVEIVEYLISVCGADVEQRGLYEVPDDRSTHCVTPLWCAAVSGKLNVVKCLVMHGANVNSVSDTGSTPVRSACFMTHLDIVSYLIEHGADILKPNYNGGTCLINSVQDVPLCVFLLKHGADVNAQDIQHKTALHYAIQEHRLETTKLLLTHGADPFLRSRYNDDALQTACLKGASQIFEYLTETVNYPPERVSDAHELMGSTFLDEHNDIHMTLYYWTTAVDIRSRNPNCLKVPLPPKTAYQNMVEFSTPGELRNVALDLDAMRVQSLLICERILGSFHKDTLFRLMYRGAAYADALQYQRCIDLWRYALELRVHKDSVLYSDTCFTAQALVRLYLDLHEKNLDRVFNEELLFEDVRATLVLLSSQLAESRQLLQIHPIHKRQQDSFDRILKCVTHLIHLLVETARSATDTDTVRELVMEVVRSNPRSSAGDSLLHLSVSRMNTIKSSYFVEENQLIFPNLRVVRLLLDCGAPVNALNDCYSTPLHVASLTPNFNNEVVRELLDHGAHLDQQNRTGDQAMMSLSSNVFSTIQLLRYSSLRCLAATVVCQYQIPYRGQIPTTLEGFVALHQPVANRLKT